MDEWIYDTGKACYNSSVEGYAINQPGLLTLDKLYVITVTISDMTKGKLILDSIEGKPEFTEDGVYNVVGFPTQIDLIFIGGKEVIHVFDGCIDAVGARVIPFYQIKDASGAVVFTQTDETGVTAYGNNIQYLIDWTGLSDGCYTIVFNDGIIEYETDQLYVNTEHDCTIQLTWTNNENAYGFDYANLEFTQSLRVKGKKWKPKYSKDKEVFKDSQGNRNILRSDTSKVEILTLNEAPEYVHDAYAIGIEHDNFEIDSLKYVVEDTEHLPKWRNSSQLASSDTEVIKDSQNLINENCA